LFPNQIYCSIQQIEEIYLFGLLCLDDGFCYFLHQNIATFICFLEVIRMYHKKIGWMNELRKFFFLNMIFVVFDIDECVDIGVNLNFLWRVKIFEMYFLISLKSKHLKYEQSKNNKFNICWIWFDSIWFIGLKVIVEEGDLLWVPAYWFHCSMYD
jgi:hypothetical protein